GREDAPDQALVAASVARRDDAPDDREREREEPTGAEALERAEDDQLRHPPRRAAERRADEEEPDRDEEERPPPVDVAELPVQRHGDRGREHVRREDPRVAREPAEVADDPRQRGRDDRLVERREEERHHQPRVDGEDAAFREPVALRLRREPGPQARPHRAAAFVADTRCSSTTSTARGRCPSRLSRMPTPIATPPTIWSGVIRSERIASAKIAATN